MILYCIFGKVKIVIMLKIKVTLEATEDFDGWQKGNHIVIFSDVFNRQNGLAYHSIDKRWEVVEMELLKYEKKDQLT